MSPVYLVQGNPSPSDPIAGSAKTWGEALHPPVDHDVVDLNPTLTEEFLDIAIGEPVPQIPAHGEDEAS